jgi:acyl carrier protein
MRSACVEIEKGVLEARIRDWCMRHLAETLKVELDRLDANTTFSRLGMDSAASIFYLVGVEEWLGTQLSAELVFEHQTVAELARHLARQPDVARALERRTP